MRQKELNISLQSVCVCVYGGLFIQVLYKAPRNIAKFILATRKHSEWHRLTDFEEECARIGVVRVHVELEYFVEGYLFERVFK